MQRLLTQRCAPGHPASLVQHPAMATQRLFVQLWQVPHWLLDVQHPLMDWQRLPRHSEHAPGH